MAGAEELGLDERATALLATLPIDKQQLALDKLAAGISAGKVRNASAYIVGVVNGPDLLDVDENAMKMLNELPSEARRAVVEKLRKATDVRNPSAWVAKAVLTAKREGQSRGPFMTGAAPFGGACGGACGGGGGCGGGGLADRIGGRIAALDVASKNLLQSLPMESQQEILGRLMIQGDVKNPSAWVSKAALQAGAVPLQAGAGMGSLGGGVGAMGFAGAYIGGGAADSGLDPTVAEMLRMGRGGQPVGLDSGALALLQSLPVETQQDLVGKLCMQEGVKNPSGWMVKACMAAGATSSGATPRTYQQPQQQRMFMSQPQPVLFQGQMELDDGARQILAKLPAATQQDILNRLAQTPEVKNPSAWVVKSAMQAGAAGGGAPAMGGGMLSSLSGAFVGGRSPAIGQPPQGNWELDQQAMALLQTLPEAAQQEILQKLTNSWSEGKVQNPSAWVAKACLKAGAAPMSGASVRASPY